MSLYDEKLTELSWTKPCGGNTGDQTSGDGNEESCVEFALVPGSAGTVVLRDSKNHSAGELRFTAAEIRAFVADRSAEYGIS
ncbi:DUF397 domain-containing protein [Actinokineospora sp.]|uniref:DUF397 domain-containing protein n=1 Tax=Actinokineospora sp. TaxID=1872133 RepID=UPI004038046B